MNKTCQQARVKLTLTEYNWCEDYVSTPVRGRETLITDQGPGNPLSQETHNRELPGDPSQPNPQKGYSSNLRPEGNPEGTRPIRNCTIPNGMGQKVLPTSDLGSIKTTQVK